MPSQLAIATSTLVGMRGWLGRTLPTLHPARGQVLALMDDLIDVLNDYQKGDARG